MSDAKTTRRQFVQLAGGLTLALRHGLVSAASGTDPSRSPEHARRVVAALEDGVVRIEWDANLHTQVSHQVAGEWTSLTTWGPSEYLVLEGSGRALNRHVAEFTCHDQRREEVDDANGPGTRLTLSGRSAEGVEKTLSVVSYRRHPGVVLLRTAYQNASGSAVTVRSWTNGDSRLPATGTRNDDSRGPDFWCYSGASYEDRRSWVRAVKPGFAQDNFLGMEASDYGGGTPIVDVWHRDGGLAVGHVETTPKRVSLPVEESRRVVRVAVCGREKRTLAPDGRFETPQTFLAVHAGDYFAALDRYRRLMSERGLTPAPAPMAAYEPIWCAWGYERACTPALIEGTLPKVKELGLKWAVIDDGWQSMIGDWNPDPAKYPNRDADMRTLSGEIRAAGLKPRLWYSPLSVAPGSDCLHDHADMLLLDKDGAVQKISWWNSFYLCPAYAKTVEHTRGLVRKFIGDWAFAGLKVDGQHLNNVAPCFNPAHHHARPEESVEGLQRFFGAIYETATAINPEVVIELCPCGTGYSPFNFPAMNQAPASDPESSWHVRSKGKTLKALMGPSAPYAGDHVELSDHHDDFASTLGVGAVVSTKFTWPLDPKPKDSFLLTPDKEREWRRWIALYADKMLPLGTYRGELYDIGFDRPEAHAIEKADRMYFAFYADRWNGPVALRGLGARIYRIRDYVNGRDVGTVTGPQAHLPVSFDRFLLLEAIPA